MLELTPALNADAPQPLYAQLYEHIRNQIEQGTLLPGVKLPSKRRLAQHLHISLNTIESAYLQLVAEGYVEAHPRSGFYVSDIRELYPAVQRIRRGAQCYELGDERLQCEYVFDHSGVDASHFPFDIWRKLYKEVITSDSASLLQLGNPQGDLGLRQALAEYLYQSRGVQCSASQIVIGSGSQYLFQLLVPLLGYPRKYAFENPGYNRVTKLCEHNGNVLLRIPLDEDGVSVEELKRAGADVVYVTPSHQFPTGTVMQISRRTELLQWAQEAEERFIIEDDYDSEFRYTGKPIPSLQGLDSNNKVIYIGTVSKALMSSLRVSYMVLPPKLLEEYQIRYSFHMQTVSRIDQKVLERFISEGYWGKHINKMRKIYGKKRDSLVAEIRKAFPSTVELIGTDAGLHVLLRPHNGCAEKELVQRAAAYKVMVYPVSVYYDERTTPVMKDTILLGFANLSEAQIREAVGRLKEAWYG